MRRAVLPPAAVIVLLGPTVLAFFAGGYFDGPRLVATIVAWALVLVVALASPRPLPTSWPGRAALGGLVLIAVWTAISFAWAPLGGAATANLVRTLLYVGAGVAALGLLRDPRAARAVEPLLALGATVVIGYGLSGRFLPGAIDMLDSAKAAGRLEQPITYWNSEGALAAIGLVLCARIVGDGSRPQVMRALAAAASALLGLGLWLSFSRAAIAAGIIGLVVLVAAAPHRSQLRAVLVVLVSAALAVASALAFSHVSSLEGPLADRERQGVIVLAIVLTVMLAAGLFQAWSATAEGRGDLRSGPLDSARRLPAVAAFALALTLAGLVASGLAERGEPSEGTGPSRLTSVESRRYDYWRVGFEAYREQPLRGLGSGGFRVAWLQGRPVSEGVLEVHSLPLEMLFELGVPGLLGFLLFLGGTAAAARRALRLRPAVAAGPFAAATVWFIHSTMDWDWQVPALTLVALILVGAIIAASERWPTADETAEESVAPPRARPLAPLARARQVG
jgi:hypothetical protein